MKNNVYQCVEERQMPVVLVKTLQTVPVDSNLSWLVIYFCLSIYICLIWKN